MCDSERECEDSSYWSKKDLRGYLATKHPTKRCMCPAHDWNVKSQYRCRQLCLVSILRVRPSRETPARHSVLPDCTIWYTHFAPTLYIPTLPTNDKESLWEKTLAKNTWELEIVIPTILYTFVCGISSSPTSPFPYHWEVNSRNTYHTSWECLVRFWCCWETLEEAKDGKCNIEFVAGSGELEKTRFREALLE